MNALEARIKDIFRGWTDGPKFLLAHPDSPPQVLEHAYFIGSSDDMLDWVRYYPHKHATVMIDTDDGLIREMKKLRPELDIRAVKIYK